jgi:hypothetical protein
LMDIVPKALPVLLKDDLEGMISLLEDSILRKGGEQ